MSRKGCIDLKTEKNVYANLSDKMTIHKSGLYSFLFAIFMITDIYRINSDVSISVGEIIFLICFLITVLNGAKYRVFYNIPLIFFLIYSFFLTVAVSLRSGGEMLSPLFRLFRDAFYWVLICVYGYTYVDYFTFEKWVKRLCIILSIIIIIQEVVFILFGVFVPMFLLDAKLTASGVTGASIYENILINANRNGYLKAPGFLSEGAHCAQMLFIGSIILIDIDNLFIRSKFLYLLMFTLASILTFSSSAVIYVCFFWGYFAFSILKRGGIKQFFGIIFISIILVFAFLILVFSGKLNFVSVLNRIINAFKINTADNSAYMRIYKGFEFWMHLPILYKLFGIGFGNYSKFSYLYSGSLSAAFESEYMNTVSYILVSSGVVGFFMFVSFMRTLYIKLNGKGRMLVWGLLLMSISSSPYSSPFWVWFMTAIIFNQEKLLSDIERKKLVRI